MARACVEDTCSVIAGNGTGNPNALALTVPLDPLGGITCNGVVQPGTPGVGLGVNLSLVPNGVHACENVLAYDPGLGAYYVNSQGIDTHLFTSVGTSVDVPIVAAPSSARVLLAFSSTIANPFTNCGAIVIAYANFRFSYQVTTVGAYWLQQTSTIEAAYTGGGFPLDGAASNPSSLVHELDDVAYNGQGGAADIAQQFDMVMGVYLPVGASVQFGVYQKNPTLTAGPAGNDASTNIRNSGAGLYPQAESDAFATVTRSNGIPVF